MVSCFIFSVIFTESLLCASSVLGAGDAAVTKSSPDLSGTQTPVGDAAVRVEVK